MRLRDWSERVERLKMCGKALSIIIPWECTFFNTAFDEGLIVVSGCGVVHGASEVWRVARYIDGRVGPRCCKTRFCNRGDVVRTRFANLRMVARNRTR